MLHAVSGPFGMIALALVCGLALAGGGAAERAGALLVALDWSVLAIWPRLAGQPVPEMALLASDLVLATGFLVLALRYASLWLGMVMLLQAGAIALHLARMGGGGLHAEATCGLGYAMLALLGGASVVAWRTRRRPRFSADRLQAGPPGPRA